MGQDERYQELPQCIKDVLSPDEYEWLSDDEKARLIQNMTEPEE